VFGVIPGKPVKSNTKDFATKKTAASELGSENLTVSAAQSDAGARLTDSSFRTQRIDCCADRLIERGSCPAEA
jgi:hypothetical protein